jgi:hypothetical protein
MRRIWQKITTKQILLPMLGGVMLAIGGTTGCSALSEQVLPANLEGRVASNGTAEDHLAAASLYQQRAQSQEARAATYERLAAALSVHEDPKGIRRSGLRTAAQERRQDADEMHQLYATHYAQAQSLLGKQQPQ